MIWKSVIIACILGILISPSVVSNVEKAGWKIATETVIGMSNVTSYYNATIKIVSSVYRVKSWGEGKIVLDDYRYPFYFRGLFYISDDNGVQICSYYGGFPNSLVTITGFEGFFKDWVVREWLHAVVWVVVWGECEKVDVGRYR